MQPQNTIKTNWIYRLKWWAKATQFANMFRIRLYTEFYFKWFPESCMRWSPPECSQHQLYSSKSHRNQDIWFGFSFHINASERASELTSVSVSVSVSSRERSDGIFQSSIPFCWCIYLSIHTVWCMLVCMCVCLFVCVLTFLSEAAEFYLTLFTPHHTPSISFCHSLHSAPSTV